MKSSKWYQEPFFGLCIALAGAVDVPADEYCILEVLADDALDLSPPSGLNPDDLTGIWLSNQRVDDQQLTHVAGLHWNDLQNNGYITDMGVEHLRNVDQLRFFGAHWTRAGDASLEISAAMTELREIDLWGCQLSKSAVKSFRDRRPDCRLVAGATTDGSAEFRQTSAPKNYLQSSWQDFPIPDRGAWDWKS